MLIDIDKSKEIIYLPEIAAHFEMKKAEFFFNTYLRGLLILVKGLLDITPGVDILESLLC